MVGLSTFKDDPIPGGSVGTVMIPGILEGRGVWSLLVQRDHFHWRFDTGHADLQVISELTVAAWSVWTQPSAETNAQVLTFIFIFAVHAVIVHSRASGAQVLWLNGEVVSTSLRQRFLDHFPKHTQLMTTYSVSECGEIACANLRHDSCHLQSSSVSALLV